MMIRLAEFEIDEETYCCRALRTIDLTSLRSLGFVADGSCVVVTRLAHGRPVPAAETFQQRKPETATFLRVKLRRKQVVATQSAAE